MSVGFGLVLGSLVRKVKMVMSPAASISVDKVFCESKNGWAKRARALVCQEGR